MKTNTENRGRHWTASDISTMNATAVANMRQRRGIRVHSLFTGKHLINGVRVHVAGEPARPMPTPNPFVTGLRGL